MADTKITALTADTSPTSDDLVVTVNDPGGTPANRKVTAANLITKAHGLSDGILKVSSSTMSVATAGTDYLTGSSTNTLTNKTFDANGTGNSLSNVEVADLAAGVLDIDLSSVSASDDTIPSAKATKTALDGKAAASHTHAQSDITNLTTDLAAKKTDSMATNKLLGRGTAGTGAIEEITLGTNLSLSGTTLNATGGGSVTVEDENLIIGMRFFGF